MATAHTFKLMKSLGDEDIGREAAAKSSDDSAVKMWLRLLSCSTQIEQEIRSRLRVRFATTLPRFDYLAQLQRHPEGLRMNALSRYLMVSGGNVTGLTDQLVAEGWVERIADTQDRRSLIVRLTALGCRRFLEMAAEHEAWLVELFAGFDPGDKHALYESLGRLRMHLAQQTAPTPDESTPAADPPSSVRSAPTRRRS